MKPITSHSESFNSNLSGAHHDLPEETYRQEPALSTSDLKLMENPRSFHRRLCGLSKNEQTPAMRLGTLFHLLILEPALFASTVKVCPDEFSDKRLKTSKEWWAANNAAPVVKKSELKQMEAMRDSMMAIPCAAWFEESITELSVFSQSAWPVPTKCRIDAYDAKRAVVLDIKTCAPGGARKEVFRRQSRALRYYWQQYNYTQICLREGIPIERWIWVVVETGGDYSAAHYTFHADDMVHAGKEVSSAYQRMVQCFNANTWPDWTPDGPDEIKLFY